MPAPSPSVGALLAGIIGARLDDVTIHDHDARDEASPHAEVVLHFSTGQTLHLWINEVEGRSESDGASLHIDVEVPRAPRRQIED